MAGSFPHLFSKSEAPSIVDRLLTTPVFALGYGGQFAVMIFFVLSGYVLSLPAHNATNPHSLLCRRLAGRYFRLNLPVIAAVLLSFALYYSGFYHNAEIGHYLENSWLSRHLSTDFNFLTAIEHGIYGAIFLGNSAFNPPLWTIHIEFIGSVLLLVSCLFRPVLKVVLMLIMLFCIFKVASPWFIFYLAIFSGAFLDVIKTGSKLILWVSLLVGLYFGAYQYENNAYLFLPATPFDDRLAYNFIGAVGLVYSVKNGVLSSLFSSSLAQFLGKISYSVYITHFLVLLSFSCWSFMAFEANEVGLWLHLTLYVSLSVSLGYVFYRLVDLPSVVVSKKISILIVKSLSVLTFRISNQTRY